MTIERSPTIVTAHPTSKLKSILAVSIWLSSFHLVAFLLLLIIFVLPLRWSITFLAVLVALIVMPLYEKSFVAVQVAKFICKHGPAHFPLTLVMEDKDALNPNQAYVFAVEPHSVLPIGIIALCHYSELLPIPRIKALASSAVFFTPFLRHVWSWLGLIPASRNNLSNHLTDGYSCILIPGGVREMLFMEHDREVVYLKRRLGFIRIAIETGSPLVPCFIFGQTHVYKWWKPKGKVYDLMSRGLRFCPLIFWGILGSPIPFPHPMHVIVGKPIEVKKNPNPSREEVSQLQTVFISCLQELYEKYKIDLGHYNVPLYVC